MSKLIETLKASSMEYSKKEGSSNAPAEKTKTSYELTQEQLADIYFTSGEKSKKSDLPLVIKVVEKPSRAITPWLITSIAFLITAFSLFSTKRIFVDIKVIDENHSFETPISSAAQTLPEESLSKKQTTAKKAEVRYGDILRMDQFFFEGAAKLNSSKDKTSLTLVNSSVAPFARAQLRFQTPLDLTNAKIVFYAKGNRGGEKLAIALKDKDNILAFEKGKFFPFPATLTTDWQPAEVLLLGTAKDFDIKNVSSLRFEVGSKDTENKPGDTIFIKDLRIVPL